MDSCTVLIRSESTGQQVTLSTTADNPDELVTIESITTRRGTGFENATITLHRNPSERFDDVSLLMEVIITDAEGFVLHEGEITGLPPEAGKVKIQSTGKYSILKDKSGFAEIYVDRDVSHWSGQPPTIRAAALTGNYSPADGSAVGATLVTSIPPPPYTSPGLPMTDLWYRAPAGVSIASLTATWTRDGGVTAGPNAYSWYAILGDDGLTTFDGNSTDLQASGPATVTRTTSTVTDARWAAVRLVYSTTEASEDSAPRGVIWSDVYVEGTHGLTTITPSTVIQNLIDRYAPGLTYDDESVQSHPYEIAHLVFDGVDGTQVVAKVNSFANWNFEVWEGGKCWYQPSPTLTEVNFVLDEDEGDVLNRDGQSVGEDYPVNGVEVFYTDVLTQLPARVGPDDDDRLTDTSDENPCNKQNRNRWGKLEMSSPCNEDDAIQVGSVWLAEHLIPSRSGSGKATGTVTTASGDEVRASRIRSGDVVRFRHESIGREVFETNYQPVTGEVTLKFDDGVATLSAILERIGIKIQLLGAAR